MAIGTTLKHIVTKPAGTARLVEGFCTLHRGITAGVTPSQLRALYPSLQSYSDAAIRGFTDIGGMLVAGTARFAADPLNSDGPEPDVLEP